MVDAFDVAAASYDSSFTHSAIGMAQRSRVYKYLVPYLKRSKPLNILELNCGTGEDALFMAKNGHKVLATDISSEMLARAKSKAVNESNISFKQLDINALEDLTMAQKLDLVFSNFGGLNCISPSDFKAFFRKAEQKVVSGGYLIAVIMSKRCLWERWYYLFKGSPKKAHRRNTKEALEVLVEGEKVRTWYYDPKEIHGFANNSFKKIGAKPIGFLIPPSYLNDFFSNNKKLLGLLSWLENKLFSVEVLSPYADHYIIVFQKK